MTCDIMMWRYDVGYRAVNRQVRPTNPACILLTVGADLSRRQKVAGNPQVRPTNPASILLKGKVAGNPQVRRTVQHMHAYGGL